jgi:pimeloyl-ACP methyl ester carboxylesterase
MSTRVRSAELSLLLVAVPLLVGVGLAFAAYAVLGSVLIASALAGAVLLTGALAAVRRRERAVTAHRSVVDPAPRGRGRRAFAKAADGTPIPVDIDGPDEAPTTVVYCNGWMLDRGSWRHQRAALSRTGVRQLFFDPRGVGFTPARNLARGSLLVHQLAADLATIVDQFAPRGRLILVGQGLGGQAVLTYAQHHAQEVRPRLAGVLLVGTPAAPGRRRPYAAASLVVAGRLPRGLRRSLGLDPTMFVPRLVSAGSSALPAARSSVGHTSLGVASAYLEAMLGYDVREAAWAVETARTAVLVPELDQLIPLLPQLELAALIRGARLLSIPNSGHVVSLDAPAFVSRELLALVDASSARLPGQRRRAAGAADRSRSARGR